MSLGGGQSFSACDDDSRKNAMDLLKGANIATIVASGNNGFKDSISSPACISTAISVGSTQTPKYNNLTQDNISSFSNSANILDVLAPGQFIESSLPDGTYGAYQGTSMAAPHVAGAWALYRQAFPDATVDEVLTALKDHGVPLTDTNGITKPRIQIDASMLNTETITSLNGTNQGWRQLGSPIQGTTYSEMFSSIWTQGFTGANITTGISNIYTYDEATRSYSAPDDAANVIGTSATDGNSAAKALLVYVFEDDNFDGTPDAWPKPLNVTGVPNTGDKVITLSRTEMGDDDEGWHMVSNPFPFSLDWTKVHADATDIHANIYVWDANKTGGADYFDTGTRGGWYGYIAPFQGFWVQAMAHDATLSFKSDHISTVTGNLYNDELEEGLDIILSHGELETKTGIYFDDDKSQLPELYNVYRLSSLSPEFLHLFTTDEHSNSSWLTQYLPHSDFTSKTVPLHLHSTNSGTFSLKIGEINLPEGMEILLIDHHTNRTVPVNESFAYNFFVEDEDAIGLNTDAVISPVEWLNQNKHSVSLNEDSPEHRFSLIINQVFTSTETNQDLPTVFNLSQNYPNPFNPTTQIQYDLPFTSDVLLEVFDITGKKVSTLVSENQNAGTHTIRFDASSLSSGVYIYRMEASGFIQTQKMTLIK